MVLLSDVTERVNVNFNFGLGVSVVARSLPTVVL